MQSVLQQALPLVFVAVAALSVHEWWRRRTEAAAWMTATLVILAYVVVAGRLLPDSGGAADVGRQLSIAILALFPYALYRFMRSFLPPIPVLGVAAVVSTAATVAWALVVDLPASGEARTGAAQAFVVVLLVHWTFVSAVAAGRLWAAGGEQPRIARARMRLMGAGAVALNLALLLAAFGSRMGDGVATVTSALALLSATGFFLGFAPPRPLRALWRRPAERTVRDIQLGLVASVRPEEVGEALEPFVEEVLGGRGTVLVGHDGQVVGFHGLSVEEAADVASRIGDGATASPDLLVVQMRSGTLAVEADPFTPYFGREELDLLEGLAAYVDLALERTELSRIGRVSCSPTSSRTRPSTAAGTTSRFPWTPPTGPTTARSSYASPTTAEASPASTARRSSASSNGSTTAASARTGPGSGWPSAARSSRRSAARSSSSTVDRERRSASRFPSGSWWERLLPGGRRRVPWRPERDGRDRAGAPGPRRRGRGQAARAAAVNEREV